MNRTPKLEFLMTEARILSEAVVDEKTGDKVIVAEVKWQQADSININNRRYRRSLLEREIEALRPAVLSKSVYGSSYHPKDGVGETHEVTHIWEDIWMNEAGECLGRVKVLPTSRGKDVQVIMRHGKVGMSSRGAGNTTVRTDVVENQKRTFEDVDDDFRLKVPGDFVLFPSVPDAGVRQLLESRIEEADDSDPNKEMKAMEIKTKDELKAAYPELYKQMEEDAEAQARSTKDADIAKAVNEAKVSWEQTMATSLDEKLKPFITEREVVLETLRSVVTLLTDIEGVVPLEKVTEEEEEDEEEEETEDIATVADLREAYPELVKEIEDAAKAKAAEKTETAALPDPPKKEEAVDELSVTKAKLAESEAKTKALEEQVAKAATVKAISEAVDAVLARDDFKRVVKLIRDEMSGDKPSLIIESVEKVEETLTAARDRIAAAMVESERQKIAGSGLKEVGLITDPEQKAGALNEEQQLRFFKEARNAGFLGSFADYKAKLSSKQ